MVSIADLKIKLYADVGHWKFVQSAPPYIAGFTTNPSLMLNSGWTYSQTIGRPQKYEQCCRDMLEYAGNRPISFEVLSEEPKEILRQAKIISSWGANVYVKIPIVDSMGKCLVDIIKRVQSEGVKVNVTAIFTQGHLQECITFLAEPDNIFSVFAGRIMDTGKCPPRIVRAGTSKTQFLWASTREVLNIIMAEENGYDIITISPDILAKLHLLGKDLNEFARETAAQFVKDGSGFSL